MFRVAPRVVRVLGALAMLAALSSCAYYNTFYLAKKYYYRGTNGDPYVAEKPDPIGLPHFNKAIDYSKKVIANHPKSKWVDDAYLLWARSLLGKDDPAQTVTMLRDFTTRYPDSPIRDEALFYLGVAGRKARNYPEALAVLVDFLGRAPKHELVPYALLERSRVLVALERPDEAAQVVTVLIERFPKHPELEKAIVLRAEALLDLAQYEHARADYRWLGTRAKTDEQRFQMLLSEADCLSAGRRYDDEIALLKEALAHEQEPLRSSTPGEMPTVQPNPTSSDRWGRLQIRIGTANVLAGRKEPALESYRRVLNGFPRSPLSAEAQYRIAYTLETLGDDFEGARVEYAKVQSQSPSSPFAAQAQQRLASLERLSQYRTQAGADSVGKKVEASFLLAELYLFQLDKPDRAIEEYRKISSEHPGTPHAAKALNAEAWVLRRKYQQESGADSILWAVVRGYPATEAQLDARDYLERAGHQVPAELIKYPERPKPAPADTALKLTPIPPVDSLAARHVVPAALDSLFRRGIIRAGDGAESAAMARARARVDSLRRANLPVPDSLRPPPADTLRARAPRDTLSRQ